MGASVCLCFVCEIVLAVCRRAYAHVHEVFCLSKRKSKRGRLGGRVTEAVGGCRDADPQSTLFFNSAVFGRRAAPRKSKAVSFAAKCVFVD